MRTDYCIKLTERMCAALIDGITGYEGPDSVILDGRTRNALVRRGMWKETSWGATPYGIATSHAAKYHAHSRAVEQARKYKPIRRKAA